MIDKTTFMMENMRERIPRKKDNYSAREVLEIGRDVRDLEVAKENFDLECSKNYTLSEDYKLIHKKALSEAYTKEICDAADNFLSGLHRYFGKVPEEFHKELTDRYCPGKPLDEWLCRSETILHKNFGYGF